MVTNLPNPDRNLNPDLIHLLNRFYWCSSLVDFSFWLRPCSACASAALRLCVKWNVATRSSNFLKPRQQNFHFFRWAIKGIEGKREEPRGTVFPCSSYPSPQTLKNRVYDRLMRRTALNSRKAVNTKRKFRATSGYASGEAKATEVKSFAHSLPKNPSV